MQRMGIRLTQAQWEELVRQAVEGEMPVKHLTRGGCAIYTATIVDAGGGFYQVPMVINPDEAFVVTVYDGRAYA